MRETKEQSNPDVKISNCPMCAGGTILSLSKMAFVTCQSCGGRGTVVTNHICACGRAVTKRSVDNLYFCGRDGCLKDLRDNVREDEIIESCDESFSPYYGWRRN